MATSHKGEQGNVKDPSHDGRLKENREAGRTKGTTPASAARQHGDGSHGSQSQAKSGESHSAGKHETGRQETASRQENKSSQASDSSDLKSREYRDEQGTGHHHTRTYQEQNMG